jgi:NDP-sugar pyrophosphorylase family protein
LADIALSNQPEPQEQRSVRAVILAGGLGTRLRPYTSILPKPLMPIGDRSILEIVIEQLSNSGITDVTLCVGYLSHLIRAVLNHRLDASVAIRYVQEEGARGTAGPLRLVDGLDDTFIVMNGDVLTTLDFGTLLRYHREKGNAVTIATRDRRIKIDYGVLHLGSPDDDARIQRFDEKPEVISTVSMGIYVIEPWVLDLIPRGRRFDFPDLVQRLLRANEPIGAYRYDGLWFDIGREEDYEEAVAVWEATHSKRRRNGNFIQPVAGADRAEFSHVRTPANTLPQTPEHVGQPHYDLEQLDSQWWSKQLGKPVSVRRRPTKYV